MEYAGNAKHKEPWQPGQRGSLCPREVDAEAAQALLEDSVADGTKRYATDGDRAYCAQEHEPGHWHGYPVGWKEVPERVVRFWRSSSRVTRRAIRRRWDG